MGLRGDNMSKLDKLKAEITNSNFEGYIDISDYLMYLGYSEHYNDDALTAKAYAIASVFQVHEKHIYDNDLVAGSIHGRYAHRDGFIHTELEHSRRVVDNYGRNTFRTNVDHYAADFETALKIGIGGMIQKIEKSIAAHSSDVDASKKISFLNSAFITMKAFSNMILQYGEEAQAKSEVLQGEQKTNLREIARICKKLSVHKPDSFHEALQLVWLIHTAFLYEKRFAMALGRLDQYLYPFYLEDISKGILTRERATQLVECTLYKIVETKRFNEHLMNLGADDVVNIAIGGVKRDGTDATNELSYIILEAVKNCNIPGPNLSARMHNDTPEEFWDKCLNVIGTGLGYPALMNDEINIHALARYGYDIEDCRDYCMVGCIENFIPGKQPAWSDGRYNSPKYLELALNNGKCMQTGAQLGLKTGDPSNFKKIDDYLAAVKKQMEFGAAEYVALFRNDNDRYDRQIYSQPFLSCFCHDCIERGLDICDGGAIYPSVHGAACMGIATVADSLAATERLVFVDKSLSLSMLRDILAGNFEGYEDIQMDLLESPKYGNNDDFVDKYARMFVDIHAEIFSKYKTRDGGGIYIGIASNISNIGAGKEVAATADGRRNGMPLSDAASPMHGSDKNGVTSVVNSTSKPDFRQVACGTVLNQKFSPAMFVSREKRCKIKNLIQVYFEKGGQEMQINAVSKEMLKDATKHPEKYADLVVRVSGFSAYFTKLDSAVQQDVLARTEHANV